MTPNELMAVRYKVIADYPGMPPSLEIGFIIEEQQTLPYFMKFVVGKYPHLFKKLAWWEERKESEMPQYVKSNNHYVRKVIKWKGRNFKDVPLFEFRISLEHPLTTGMANEWHPATEQEYLSYEQSKKL